MTLSPDRDLQQRLLLLPAAALAIGLVISLHLPLAPGWRVVAASTWLSLQGCELYRFVRRSRGFRRLQFSGTAGIRALQHGTAAVELSLRPGTLITQRYAWLRLCTADGRRFDTLLLASRVKPADWRRLQVILAFCA
ncbi:MAG: hypothetical protein WBM54_15610 [Woeseia sp.]